MHKVKVIMLWVALVLPVTSHASDLEKKYNEIVVMYAKDMKEEFEIHTPIALYPDRIEIDHVEICAFDGQVCLDGFYKRSEAEVKVYNLNKEIKGE